MKRTGKTVAYSTAAVAVVVVVLAGYAAKDRIREEWWLLRLKNGDEAARQHAAEMLGHLGCVRAVPAVLEAARNKNWKECIAYHNALVRIGKPAALAMFHAASEGPGPHWEFILDAMGDIFNNDFRIHRILRPADQEAAHQAEFVRFLNALLFVQTEEEVVLIAAAEALKKIQGKQNEARG